jgi:hypothetical protein
MAVVERPDGYLGALLLSEPNVIWVTVKRKHD